MTAFHAVRAGRAAAERLMTDSVKIVELSEQVDPLTGEGLQVLVYEGKAKLNAYASTGRTNEVISHTAVTQMMMLHLPVGDYRPQVGHLVTFVQSHDPELIGLQYRVTESAPVKTFATAYRVAVEFKAA